MDLRGPVVVAVVHRRIGAEGDGVLQLGRAAGNSDHSCTRVLGQLDEKAADATGCGGDDDGLGRLGFRGPVQADCGATVGQECRGVWE